MTVDSLVVFLLYTAVLMVVAVWATALVMWPILRWWRILGRVELSSGGWCLAGTAPFLTGIAVGCSAFSSATMKGMSIIPDHCRLDPGHPHLCWFHFQMDMPSGILFWLALIVGNTVLIGTLGRVAHSLYRLGLALRLGCRPQDDFCVVPSEVPAAFVAGILRPRIYLTTKALALLDRTERRIVLAHERAHLRRRDPLKLVLLRIAACLFPGFKWLEERWKAAAEVECDWACYEGGEEAEKISLTILKLARNQRADGTAPVLAYAAGPGAAIRERVERLLSGVSPRCSRGFQRWLILVAMVALVAGISSIHHVLEAVLANLTVRHSWLPF